jgi:hypothetical protein
VRSSVHLYTMHYALIHYTLIHYTLIHYTHCMHTPQVSCEIVDYSEAKAGTNAAGKEAPKLLIRVGFYHEV